MIIAVVPLLVALIGALTFALSSNGNVKEMGRIAFAVGLLILIWSMAGKIVRFG